MDFKFFTNRKTIRNYQQKDIDEAQLNSMLEAATHAPTTGNMQLYSIVISRDADKKKALAPAHFNQPMVTNAPVVLTFCADFNRFIKWCENSNAVPGYNNLQSFISAMLDTTIVAQQFVTIAESNGLGCCYLGTTSYNAAEIGELLQLPKMVIPIITVTLGYPKGEEKKSDRLPLSAIIHNECYHGYSDNEITDIYSEKESLPENKAFVAENGKETLAQVFTDVRYSKSNNDYFSTLFYKYIIQQGFDFPTE